MGHPLGHMDAAHLWDSWSKQRPLHLAHSLDDSFEQRFEPCNLQGWWRHESEVLALQNVSQLFASRVSKGGFEMFNVSAAALEAVPEAVPQGVQVEMAMPRPEASFQHLHSFLSLAVESFL